MTELKALFAKRSSVKGRLTKFHNYLDTILSITEPSAEQLNELALRLAKIESLAKTFDDLQCQIEILNSDALDSELDERELIEQDFYKFISKAQLILSNEKPKSNASNSMPSGGPSFKLPQIQISKFDGSLHHWLEFRDMFVSLIHENPSIQPVHKFHYLNSYLEGEAARVTSNLEMSVSNYDKAWSLLCDRFNNKRQLISYHLNSLFNTEKLNRESDRSLRTLIDNVNKNLRALASLGEPTDSWDTLIIHMITSKLDSPTNLKWEEHRNTLSDSPTLAIFNKFLKDRADVLESCSNNKFDQSKPQTPHKSQAKTYTCTAQLSHNTNPTFACVFCKATHRIYDCPNFLALPVEQRIAEAAKLGLCFNCLRLGHHSSRCPMGPCRECRKRHNSLLHKVLPSPQPATSASSVAQADTAVNISVQPTNLVFLSTALLRVINPKTNKECVVRALLDSGSQSSFITESLKQTLGLDALPTNIKVIGIGNTNSSSVSERSIVQFQSTNSDFKVTLSCSVLREITGDLPKVHVDLKEFKFPPKIMLADPSFNTPAPIDVLIGADIFWDVVGDKQQSLGKGKPYLRSSQLGWIVSGPMCIDNCEPIYNSRSNFSLSLHNMQEDVTLNNQFARCRGPEVLPQSKPLLSDSEIACEKYLLTNTTRLDNGQFSNKLPDSPECLGESYINAKKRLLALDKLFRKQLELKTAYSTFIQEHCSESAVLNPELHNYFGCHDTEAELLNILESLTDTLSSACLHLRKFRPNLPSFFKNSNYNLNVNETLSDSTNTLGLG